MNKHEVPGYKPVGLSELPDESQEDTEKIEIEKVISSLENALGGQALPDARNNFEKLLKAYLADDKKRSYAVSLLEAVTENDHIKKGQPKWVEWCKARAVEVRTGVSTPARNGFFEEEK